ncbi:hypothetical protein Cgig2_011706 [Carnegiea gigantea]|uniref:Small ribosomal subunit protein eS1 n=1 Tax=Carnegiea gigantea TaxID=171969 RepID=A0A9Q1JXP0_9CARY|nr:hypothetical protein Cgig2_011706 [Carnegiea gigantea]
MEAAWKNKRISKGKKGGKKKATDPFAKKDWYDIKAPSLFHVRNVGKTLVTRTQGTKIASEGLKHRVFEVSLADLQNDEDQFFKKIRLRAEDVQGRNVLTNFWGMDFTTDKLRSLVRKWQTLIEAHVDVKTTDNYTLRMFCIAFTKRRPNQVKRTTYAQSSQIRQIRRKMREIMVNQASSCDLKDLVAKFIPESIGKEIEKATSSIYPLQNVYIRKVKILKAPKFDLGKLMEVHGDYSEDVGVKLDRPADETMAEGETTEASPSDPYPKHNQSGSRVRGLVKEEREEKNGVKQRYPKIQEATPSIYPLENVYIRVVKILKVPKFDLRKLMENYDIKTTSVFLVHMFIHVGSRRLLRGSGREVGSSAGETIAEREATEIVDA